MKRLNMISWIKWTTAVLVLAVFVGCSSTNWVGREDESLICRAPRKLARGTINVLSGPMGIFNQPIRLAEKEQSFERQAAGVVTGVPVGIGYVVGRTLAGTFDIVTAPILVPQRTIIEPEFMSPDLIDWSFD
jgi:putative exosortase-associated protein (TIGR04073 family)